MIAKRIPREKGTSSPARLVKYMVAAQGQLDPQTWARTADYILETNDTTHKGEKVGSYRVTNCETDDPAAATVLIEATQSMNSRSKNDKTYHLVFSFPPGEEPSLEDLHAIEDDLVGSIGYADHQRISAVHVDTDHLHVHVAINKVHPTGLQNIEPYYDKKRLMEACERLEIKHDLQRTNHGLEKNERTRDKSRSRDRDNSIELDPARRPELADSRFRRYLRESYNHTFTDEPKAESFNSLRKLSGCGMDDAAKRAKMLLSSDAPLSLEQGGTAPVHGLRRAGTSNHGVIGENGRRGNLVDDFSASQAAEFGAFAETALSEGEALKAQPITGKAADIEKHSGLETLTGYVAREVAPSIREATSWKDVHATLADHGLVMTQRGAGLIVGDPELPLWARASNCSRDLSLKSMTDRLGPFEKSKGATKPNKKYEAKPRQEHPSSAALFAQYQRERQANIASRRTGLNDFKAENAQFKADLKSQSKLQRALLKVSGKGGTKKVMSAMITRQANAARENHRKAMDAKRTELISKSSTPTWAEWLRQQAETGNVDALEILRTREQREERFKTDLLTAGSADKAKTYIMKGLKPQARNDGSMAYRTADGGMVIDGVSNVRAEKATTGAALVALELASKRFDGQKLIVEGSDTFKSEVAKLAGLHKLNVSFADPKMEKARLQSVSERNAVIEKTTLTVSPAPHDISKLTEGVETPKENRQENEETATKSNKDVENFIEERNKMRDKLSSIDYHKLWSSNDAGPVTYEGRRKMKDGSEVLLLKRGDEILVKPSSERVVAKAAKWKIGSTVNLDARGRFVSEIKSKTNGIGL